MESVIMLLSSILTMRHCTVAPLSAVVTFCMVMLDGFGPDVVSVDVILTVFELAFRSRPKASVTQGTPWSAVMLHTSSTDPVALSQEKVKSSPEQARSLTRRRVTKGKDIILGIMR